MDIVESPERPWVFGLLIAPSAVVANGVVQGGVLAYLLSEQGIGSGKQSHLLFLLGLPTWLYFLWSPVTDFFVRRRTWLLAGGLLAAILMWAGFHQKNLSSGKTALLMLLSACCSQIVVSSCGGMMGALRTDEGKRVAGSFYQAGSMGFGSLAAWALVYLSSRVSRDMLGLASAALIAVPTLFVFFAPAQELISEDSFSATLRHVGQECKATFCRKEAIPYALCMLFPGASGAAVGLLAGVAKQYGVNGDHVAWVNGLLGGVVVALGSGALALLRTRMRAAVLFMSVSLSNCAAISILWLGPMRPSTYYAGVLLYLFTVGLCYAAFTAVVLEFLGASGKSGSMRYSIINSLGNVPVQYMLLADGWGGEKWGGRGLAGVETILGGLGSVILLGYFLTTGRKKDAGLPGGPEKNSALALS